MGIEINGLLPTHQRIMKVLLDGLPHKRSELHACLQDELADSKTVISHLCNLRKILRPKGLDVVCRSFGGRGYHRFQLVRLLNVED